MKSIATVLICLVALGMSIGTVSAITPITLDVNLQEDGANIGTSKLVTINYNTEDAATPPNPLPVSINTVDDLDPDNGPIYAWGLYDSNNNPCTGGPDCKSKLYSGIGIYSGGTDIVIQVEGYEDYTFQSVTSNVGPVDVDLTPVGTELAVTVLYPNGGESIPVGTQVQVSAHATDYNAVTSVTFYYSNNGGSTWNQIGAGTRVSGTAKDGTWNKTWNTNGLSAGTNYLIKAVASDGTSSDEDQSDSTFSLTCTPPLSPALNDPGTTDTDGSYTVSWSSVSGATYYTLEEDTSSSFSSPTVVYSGTGTSKYITGKSNGTYYYRVNACNACGCCSGWSNEEDIEVEIPGSPPDLIVTEITLNCEYLFANQHNEICAAIKNIGNIYANAFHVSFSVGDFSEDSWIEDGLATGSTTTVCVTDTSQRNAGYSASITVTADCDSEVLEANEANNVANLDTTVMYNGYKGKRYTGGEDISTWKTFELNGNLLYSVGDSYYLSSASDPHWTTYNARWTASDLPIPGAATIVEARLYVIYVWDKTGVVPTYVDMSFNGNPQTPDALYSDEKGWSTSNPYGMLAYEVTDVFQANGNVANLTNSYPGGGNVSMRGMLLVVVYADDSESKRKIIMNEGFDMLYGGSSHCTTPDEATAYASFGAIGDISNTRARLITVAPGAGSNEGDLIFNGHIWNDVWDFVGTGSPTPQIGIDDRDITDYLSTTANEAGFRSDGDYMEASNAILVVETQSGDTGSIFDTGSGAYPSIMGTHTGTITPSQDIPVQKLYTYPCAGTGGHTEYARLWNNSGLDRIATWSGYKDDWHNITFDDPFTLFAGKTYYYEIRTGSYPQIIHKPEHTTLNGSFINCTSFVDANGEKYYDWIPAIRLWA